jgi:hypothetical protein
MNRKPQIKETQKHHCGRNWNRRRVSNSTCSVVPNSKITVRQFKVVKNISLNFFKIYFAVLFPCTSRAPKLRVYLYLCPYDQNVDSRLAASRQRVHATSPPVFCLTCSSWTSPYISLTHAKVTWVTTQHFPRPTWSTTLQVAPFCTATNVHSFYDDKTFWSEMTGNGWYPVQISDELSVMAHFSPISFSFSKGIARAKIAPFQILRCSPLYLCCRNVVNSLRITYAPPFMEPENSLPCSQEPTAGLCPEPDESNPYVCSHVLFTSIKILLKHILKGCRCTDNRTASVQLRNAIRYVKTWAVPHQ